MLPSSITTRHDALVSRMSLAASVTVVVNSTEMEVGCMSSLTFMLCLSFHYTRLLGPLLRPHRAFMFCVAPKLGRFTKYCTWQVLSAC